MSDPAPPSHQLTVRVVKPGTPFRGKQGHVYTPAISGGSVGAKALHMQVLRLPPNEIGKAHKHESHETAIYIVSGRSAVWFGERLDHHAAASAGEFVYIPAGLPHLPYNPSPTEECVAVIARTDPNEQESVVLLPELDGAMRDSLRVLA
ncbi:cupin domain-containing protein [Enterovirga aerilata]|uniref:Cupin domain-containing protein n=1 Tax=Enterovirga aerilata TaxID=2730920 RepID=A0A849I1X8_9HYPH|nr:cupin domain-containing protein [Enterovirga sp. DB1703]NNM71614.1 cupin domain-containing protein [Enterovirga sp. DB1703]